MNFINYKYFDRWTITQCKTFIQQNLITCLPKKRHVSLFLLEKHKIGKKKKRQSTRNLRGDLREFLDDPSIKAKGSKKEAATPGTVVREERKRERKKLNKRP